MVKLIERFSLIIFMTGFTKSGNLRTINLNNFETNTWLKIFLKLVDIKIKNEHIWKLFYVMKNFA